MLSVILYISAIVAANLSVFYFGPWISPINSFLFIGLDLSLRDRLHDRWHRDYLGIRMFSLIMAAGAISYLLNPVVGIIVLASVVAFILAALTDMLGYQALYHKRFLIRSNGSNVVGALVDSVVFPTIAFGVFLPEIIVLQFMSKVLGGAMWTILINWGRESRR